MANWGSSVLTVRGRNLDAKVRAGKTNMVFTKFKFGDGLLPSGQSYDNRTDLISPRLNVGITSTEAQSVGVTEVSTVITNAELSTGFNMREMGLFAQDPDLGEILYLVMTDSDYDNLPAKGGSTVVTVDFSVFVSVDDVTKTTAVLDPNGLLKLRDLTKHNDAEDAHEPLFTTDNTPTKDASITSKISKLGARIKWVRDYVKDKIDEAMTVVDNKIESALGAYNRFKASQISDFADEVIAAIRDKTFASLGVRYSFTNPNSWYICLGVLFGGLIIQGGISDFSGATYKDVTLPINAKVVLAVPVDTYVTKDTSDSGNQVIKFNTGSTTNSSIRFLTNLNTTYQFGWFAFCA